MFAWISTFAAHSLSHSRPGSDAATAIANLATAIAKSANLAQIRTNALQNLAQNSAGRRRTNAVAIGGELRTYRVVTEVGADIYAKDDDGWMNAAALAAKYGHFKS